MIIRVGDSRRFYGRDTRAAFPPPRPGHVLSSYELAAPLANCSNLSTASPTRDHVRDGDPIPAEKFAVDPNAGLDRLSLFLSLSPSCNAVMQIVALNIRVWTVPANIRVDERTKDRESPAAEHHRSRP